MTNKIYTAGLVGLGQIGFQCGRKAPRGQVLSHAQALLGNKRIQLLWGMDPDSKIKKTWETKTKTPWIQNFSGAQEFKNPDLLVIATPTAFHKKSIEAALCLKPKLILLEKPIAPTLSEAKTILALCKKQGVKLFINYHLSFDLAHQKLIQFLRKGSLGKFRGGHVYYYRGLFNNASHSLEYFLKIFGKPTKIQKLKFHQKLFNGKDLDLDFQLEFQNHHLIYQNLKREHCIVSESDLLFEKGRVKISDGFAKIQVYKMQKHPSYPDFQVPTKEIPFAKPNLHKRQAEVLKTLIEQLDFPKKNFENTQSALAALELAQAIQKASL